jgi:hypothetical protein
MERAETFTEQVVHKATDIFRNNPDIKKDELIFRLKHDVGLKGTAEDAKLYEAWKLEPEALHKLLVKIAEIVILLEDSSRKLAGRKRSKK